MRHVQKLGRAGTIAACLFIPLAVQGRARADAPPPLTSRETVLPPSEAGLFVRHDLRPGSRDRVSFWAPGPEDLRRLQAAYRAVVPVVGLADPEHGLPRTDVTDYYRQYVGIIENGRRLILINGFSPRYLADGVAGKSVADESDWRARAVFVFDGGRSFFYALYDTQARQVVRFVFNGR